MLQAAANPDAERPEMVAATLPGERRQNVQATMQTLHSITGGVAQRGRQALLDMDDAEWQKLVDEANGP